MDTQTAPQKRRGDRSNAEAQLAIEATLGRFTAWRNDLALFAVQAERHSTPEARVVMRARCEAIAAEVQAARVGLLVELIDAPRNVVGHSRVADVEKALDGLDASLATLRRKLAD